MSGFAKVPNDLAFDSKLSFGARATYPALAHMAWKAGRRKQEDAVELPPLDEVAEAVGCSRTALRGYLRELREAGWVHTTRTARQRPQTYWILDAADPDFVVRNPPHESEVRSAESDTLSRARGSLPLTKTVRDVSQTDTSLTASSDFSKPPKLTKISVGDSLRDVAFDRLADVTGATDANAAKEVAVALNGSKGLVGIRQLAWDELTPQAREAYRAAPQAFELYLATQIIVRADAYRNAMRDALLTPTALAKWWGRVEGLSTQRGRLLTLDEMDKLVEDAHAQVEAERAAGLR